MSILEEGHLDDVLLRSPSNCHHELRMSLAELYSLAISSYIICICFWLCQLVARRRPGELENLLPLSSCGAPKKSSLGMIESCEIQHVSPNMNTSKATFCAHTLSLGWIPSTEKVSRRLCRCGGRLIAACMRSGMHPSQLPLT